MVAVNKIYSPGSQVIKTLEKAAEKAVQDIEQAETPIEKAVSTVSRKINTPQITTDQAFQAMQHQALLRSSAKTIKIESNAAEVASRYNKTATAAKDIKLGVKSNDTLEISSHGKALSGNSKKGAKVTDTITEASADKTSSTSGAAKSDNAGKPNGNDKVDTPKTDNAGKPNGNDKTGTDNSGKPNGNDKTDTDNSGKPNGNDKPPVDPNKPPVDPNKPPVDPNKPPVTPPGGSTGNPAHDIINIINSPITINNYKIVQKNINIFIFNTNRHMHHFHQAPKLPIDQLIKLNTMANLLQNNYGCYMKNDLDVINGLINSQVGSRMSPERLGRFIDTLR